MPELQIGVNSAGFFQGEKPSITLLRLEVYQVLRCGGLMVGSGKVRWNLKCDKNRGEKSSIRGIWCEKIMLLAFSCSAVTVVKAFKERGGAEMCWYCEAWRVMWISVSSFWCHLRTFAYFDMSVFAICCVLKSFVFVNPSCIQQLCWCMSLYKGFLVERTRKRRQEKKIPVNSSLGFWPEKSCLIPINIHRTSSAARFHQHPQKNNYSIYEW